MKDMLKSAISVGIMISLPIACASIVGAALYKVGFCDGRELNQQNDISRENQAV